MGTRIHYLKTSSEYFGAIHEGEKSFELRKEDDRRFSKEDIVILREVDSDDDNDSFTGREIVARITYVLARSHVEASRGNRRAFLLGDLVGMLPENCVIFSFDIIERVFSPAAVRAKDYDQDS